MKTLRILIITLSICLTSALIGAKVTPPDGFVALFDGKTMEGWYTQPDNLQTVWSIDSKEGVLARSLKNGYIWTKKTYSDFILEMEFKMSRNCNSGLFYRTNPSDPVQKGFEIQLFDTPPDMEMNKHTIGALYDAQAASSNPLNPVNKWNKLRLHIEGYLIKVWINDVLVNEADFSKWTTAEKNPDGTKNKFKTALGKLPTTGHIGFQDHGHNVAFKNIFIKEL